MKLPQLHLRDLFWLVLVCAMGCAWWLERQEIAVLAAKVDGLREANDDYWETVKGKQGLIATWQDVCRTLLAELRKVGHPRKLVFDETDDSFHIVSDDELATDD